MSNDPGSAPPAPASDDPASDNSDGACGRGAVVVGSATVRACRDVVGGGVRFGRGRRDGPRFLGRGLVGPAVAVGAGHDHADPGHQHQGRSSAQPRQAAGPSTFRSAGGRDHGGGGRTGTTVGSRWGIPRLERGRDAILGAVPEPFGLARNRAETVPHGAEGVQPGTELR